jgi:hypothetical protein
MFGRGGFRKDFSRSLRVRSADLVTSEAHALGTAGMSGAAVAVRVFAGKAEVARAIEGRGRFPSCQIPPDRFQWTYVSMQTRGDPSCRLESVP